MNLHLTWTGILLCGLMLGCGTPESQQPEQSAEKTGAPQPEADGKIANGSETSSLPPAPEPDKQINAKSFINKPAPKLVVEEWLSPKVPSLEGKMVLVDFWATWCGPCVAGIPKLNQFHRKYKDRLVIVGLSDEEKAKVQSFERVKINYPLAIDPEQRMAQELEIVGIPHIILIDPTGIVRWEGHPAHPDYPLSEEVLDDLLDTYVP